MHVTRDATKSNPSAPRSLRTRISRLGRRIPLLKPFVRRTSIEWLKLLVEFRWLFHSQRKARDHGLPTDLIVSLTSYPDRFPTLHKTLKCLLMQNVRPTAVVLWIAHEDAPALPENVRTLTARGLTIRLTENLRSYKKIIPALATFPDAIIVTADDDVYYPPGWLKGFVEEYNPSDNQILCYRGHFIRSESGKILPYDLWDKAVTLDTASYDMFFTGVGGVLYPPHILHHDATDINLIHTLCPTTDDVWLNWMARLNGAMIRKVGCIGRFYEWPGSQTTALMHVNVGDNAENDRQIANVVSKYGTAHITIEHSA